MDSDLTPLHWLHNIDIMSHCAGFEENQENRKNSNNVTVVDQTDYRTTNKKPPLSYSSLITKAIKSTPNNKLTLSQIYSWIKENYLFYSTAEPSWQNSIRHNLSLNKCFVKIPRGKDEPGKGGFWSLDESLVGRSGSKRKKKKKTNKVLATVTNGNICSLVTGQQQQHPHPHQHQHQQNGHTQLLSNSCLILNDSNDTGHDTGTRHDVDNDSATGVGVGLDVGSPSNATILHNIDNSSSSNNSNNNHTIILTAHHPDDSNCVDICQEAFSTHEEIVESEIIESELILENVYWESVLDLDHLISIGEL